MDVNSNFFSRCESNERTTRNEMKPLNAMMINLLRKFSIKLSDAWRASGRRAGDEMANKNQTDYSQVINTSIECSMAHFPDFSLSSLIPIFNWIHTQRLFAFETDLFFLQVFFSVIRQQRTLIAYYFVHTLTNATEKLRR